MPMIITAAVPRVDIPQHLGYRARPVQRDRIRTLAILGGQWGDEGKGKFVDLLADRFDAVARYHGGHNAGHTVRFGSRHFALHLLPAGILRGKPSWIGEGVVIDPGALAEEIRLVEGEGIDVKSHLSVSDRAHLILPYHQLLDAAREKAAGEAKLGTTLRGIGPAYETRAARSGIRVGALRHPASLSEKVDRLARELGSLAGALGESTIPSSVDVSRDLLAHAEWLCPLTADIGARARKHLKSGGSLLAEGAHGAMLDISAGSYPFVTSSVCTSAGLAAGLGIAPGALDASLVILKAYATRVGAGPFPTELSDDTGEFLRRRGNEFGTSTGRPRRTGWFDAVVARTAVALSGAEFFAVTKLDVLDTLAEIPVCVAYQIEGTTVDELPSDIEDWERVSPVWEVLSGWESDTRGTTELARLPRKARDYVVFLEKMCGARAVAVSTGPRREETLICCDPEFWDRLPAAS
jgi:adenylosuccinate synthase